MNESILLYPFGSPQLYVDSKMNKTSQHTRHIRFKIQHIESPAFRINFLIYHAYIINYSRHV